MEPHTIDLYINISSDDELLPKNGLESTRLLKLCNVSLRVTDLQAGTCGP